MSEFSNQQYVNAAKRLYEREGKLEIDEYDPADSEVSRGSDPGAYVKGWIWVDDEDIKPEDGDAEESQQS